MDSHKTCAHCVVARGWLQIQCSGWLFENVEEELREHFKDEGYNHPWVGRAVVSMRRRWKARDGSLMPIPSPAPPQAYLTHWDRTAKHAEEIL